MSWTQGDFEYSTVQKICLTMVKYGPVPKHVAFIMDGNRRFASEKQLRRCDGHLQGFSKLSEVLRWCKDFGIDEVSVFAFSIENFKRATEEVSFLMDLAEKKLKELHDKSDDLLANGVCVRVIGNLSLLPVNIQQLAAKVMLLTKNNSRQTLNICMAYMGRDEITQAVETVRMGVQDGVIIASDITPQLLSKCMYMRLSKPLDLLIRTSGEVRLSDFLIWQAAENGAVFQFWTSAKVYCSNEDRMDEEKQIRTDRFLELVDKRFWEKLSTLT